CPAKGTDRASRFCPARKPGQDSRSGSSGSPPSQFSNPRSTGRNSGSCRAHDIRSRRILPIGPYCRLLEVGLCVILPLIVSLNQVAGSNFLDSPLECWCITPKQGDQERCRQTVPTASR